MKNPLTRCANAFIAGLRRLFFSCLLLTIALLVLGEKNARANVYATNVRLNGGTTNVALAPGGSVIISYLLNESATLGVTVAINQGATTVRTIALPGGGPGTAPGTNAVTWDGRDSIGHMLGAGTYSVSVSAAASGYTNWTQISSDTNINNQLWEPRGVAVNVNPGSPYYGRIFMANADDNFIAITIPGDHRGILKLQPDGSAAEEGILSTNGLSSPSKIEVGSDDRVYVNNNYTQDQPTIFSFDQIISTNSQREVLAPENYPQGHHYDGPFVSGAGTNMQLWMVDEANLTQGIIRWNLSADGTVAPSDVGTNVVAAGFGTPIDQYPADVAVDSSNRIYTIQYAVPPSAPDNRLLRYPAYTNVLETTNTDWVFVTNGDSFTGGYGVAVDPTAKYVAVGYEGPQGSGGDGTGGFAAVFDAATGTNVIATLAPTNIPQHQFFDVSWDNVGNLYALDQGNPNDLNSEGLLRIYSPPGTNQATTVAIGTIQISGTTTPPPTLSEPVYVGQTVRFTLHGQPNVTYIILASSNLFNWYPVATNTSVLADRDIVLPAPPGQTYYRAVVGQYQPAQPMLTAQAVVAGQFQFTLTGEPYMNYTILGSADMNHWTPVTTNSSTNAVRTISVPATNSLQYFRARVP